VTDPVLMRALAHAARALAAPGAGEPTLAQVLVDLRAETGAEASFDEEQRLVLRWPDGGGPGRDDFEQALAHVLTLGREVIGRQSDGILDPQAFLAELERCASAARWRDRRLALCIFDVEGMLLGPGIDESQLVDRVGSAARRAVRHGDVVGHLGAARFALLFPRAGTFEARAAYRRVRDAVGLIEMDGDGLACGPAGYAELDEEGSGDLLADALGRLQAARVRQAYTGPIGPGSPSTPLAG
jgi:GGDEF domain-containing protein